MSTGQLTNHFGILLSDKGGHMPKAGRWLEYFAVIFSLLWATEGIAQQKPAKRVPASTTAASAKIKNPGYADPTWYSRTDSLGKPAQKKQLSQRSPAVPANPALKNNYFPGPSNW
jgi:hypothetical protein